MNESETSNPVPAPTAPLEYTVDPAVSRFTIRAFAGGLLSAFAHNPTFAVRRYKATLAFDPSAPDTASVRIVVEAASLELTDQVSDRDRREIERVMHEDVLEVARFPSIAFTTTRVESRDVGGGRYRASAHGPFALHGVTRDLTIEADAVTMGSSLHVYGECPLRQTDFNIKLVSVAGQAIKVKDELKCVFDLVARRRS